MFKEWQLLNCRVCYLYYAYTVQSPLCVDKEVKQKYEYE